MHRMSIKPLNHTKSATNIEFVALLVFFINIVKLSIQAYFIYCFEFFNRKRSVLNSFDIIKNL